MLEAQEAKITENALRVPNEAYSHVEYSIRQSQYRQTAYAVQTIIKNKLYKIAGKQHTTQTYFEDRWGLSRAQAYRVADSVEVLELLEHFDILPDRESIATFLKANASREQIPQVWSKAIQKAKGTTVTIKHVKDSIIGHQKSKVGKRRKRRITKERYLDNDETSNFSQDSFKSVKSFHSAQKIKRIRLCFQNDPNDREGSIDSHPTFYNNDSSPKRGKWYQYGAYGSTSPTKVSEAKPSLSSSDDEFAQVSTNDEISDLKDLASLTEAPQYSNSSVDQISLIPKDSLPYMVTPTKKLSHLIHQFQQTSSELNHLGYHLQPLVDDHWVEARQWRWKSDSNGPDVYMAVTTPTSAVVIPPFSSPIALRDSDIQALERAWLHED